MAEYPNSGIMFPNDRKQGPKSPDFQGTATIDGKKKRVACWKRTGAKGEYFTFAFQDPRPPGVPGAPAQEAAPAQSEQIQAADEGNTVPF